MKKKDLKKLIAAVAAVAAVVIIYLISFSNDRIMITAKNARLNVTERKKNAVTVSSNGTALKKEDAVLIRHAKTAFESEGLFGIEIVLQTSDGHVLAKTVTEENFTKGNELPLYMEETLLDFKLRLGLKSAKDVSVKPFPQCEISPAPESNGRTVNIEVPYGEFTAEEISALIENLNEKGAAVYVYNVAFTDTDGTPVEIISADTVKKTEITVKYDTDK